MPFITQWRDPEVFLKYNHVTIYHVYKDDEFNQGPRHFWYTLDPARGDDYGEEKGVFDIRDAPNPNRHDLEVHEGQKRLMRELIDAKRLAAYLDADGFVETTTIDFAQR